VTSRRKVAEKNLATPSPSGKAAMGMPFIMMGSWTF
jgi:hypothetical protein